MRRMTSQTEAVGETKSYAYSPARELTAIDYQELLGGSVSVAVTAPRL
jgi:hypothetical protein